MKRKTQVIWWELRDSLVLAWLPVLDRWAIGPDRDRAVASVLQGATLPDSAGALPQYSASRRVVEVPMEPSSTRPGPTLSLELDAVVFEGPEGWTGAIPAWFAISDGRVEAPDQDALWDQVSWRLRSYLGWGSEGRPVVAMLAPPLRCKEVSIPVLSTRDAEPAAASPPPELLARAEPEPPPSSKAGPDTWAHEDQIPILAGLVESGAHLVLLSEPGMGGSEVLREVARRLERPVWRTNPSRLEAGARYFGEREGQVDAVVRALASVRGVLWMEDLTSFFQRPSPERSIAAHLARPVREGAIRLIGEISPQAWERIQVRAPELAAQYHPWSLRSVLPFQTTALLDRLAALYRGSEQVEILPEASRRAVTLLERFARQERFPGKAFRLMTELVTTASREGRAQVSEGDVVEGFARSVGLPLELVDDRLPLPRAEVAARLERRLCGQPEAVAAMSRVVVSWKAGLNDPNRPIATLMFAGPTGVGKTAAAKALADLFLGGSARRGALVRLDMSELGTPDAMERVLGTPRQPSAFLRQLRERPLAVVLFDEIEKAHPVIFDLLLGILDEGRLADATGALVDLRGTILVLTTNVGTRVGGSLGFGVGQVGFDRGALQKTFRPEFLDRLDEVVAFRSLDEESIRDIARRELEAVADRPGLAQRGLGVAWSEAVLDLVVAVGFDPKFGARPLLRAVESRVVAVLSRFLVDRPDLQLAVLRLDVADGKVVVEIDPA